MGKTKASIRSQVRQSFSEKPLRKKMKIAALVSVVAAGRQARDTQSLFKKILGNHNSNVEQRNFTFSETDSLYQIFQFYMGSKAKISQKLMTCSLTAVGVKSEIKKPRQSSLVAVNP